MASNQTRENNVCAVCRLFPSVFIKMKMRRFIRLCVKEMRLYPGSAQCENIQCFPPIQMATLRYEQCMAQRTTRHTLTSEYKKSLPSMKEPPFPVFHFFRSDGIIVQFTVSLQQWKIISRSSSAFKSHVMVFRYNKAQKYCMLKTIDSCIPESSSVLVCGLLSILEYNPDIASHWPMGIADVLSHNRSGEPQNMFLFIYLLSVK